MIDKITITLEEYKELLIIKGKYEELKSRESSWIKPTINWREYGKPDIDPNPKVTFKTNDKTTTLSSLKEKASTL